MANSKLVGSKEKMQNYLEMLKILQNIKNFTTEVTTTGFGEL